MAYKRNRNEAQRNKSNGVKFKRLAVSKGGVYKNHNDVVVAEDAIVVFVIPADVPIPLRPSNMAKLVHLARTSEVIYCAKSAPS